mmetsp:Transcript_26910/g.71055  ORF Transcript_26910/g.71055 Transcript_26910/m.71055 type:complete len:258 (+) Transcript_26910:389-1162(+)
MVGPVLSALMRHLATTAAVETVNAPHELEPLGRVETFGREAQGMNQSGWEDSIATPVMRHLVPNSLAWELQISSVQASGWQGWLGRDDMSDDDDDDDYSMVTFGGVTITEVGSRRNIDRGLMIDLEDGFALPPPAVDLDLDDGLDATYPSLLAAGAGMPFGARAPLSVPARQETGDDSSPAASHYCDRSSRQRFTLPAHVVKDELAFSATSAAQPHRCRPSGCKAVRVGRRRVAVRSRQAALAPRSKRRCQPCGSPL